MNAVAKELQEVNVELQSREHRRKLFVKHKPEYSFWWAGVYPPGKWRIGNRCIAYASAFDSKDIGITEFKDGDIALIVDKAAFPITRAEADRLIASFGFEVKKL